MNKTVNINLGNRIFTIEEEAYVMLDKYLNSLRQHFAPQDPEGEIVNDFEQRLSELFEDKHRLGHQVMTVEITKKVIDRLGDTSEIFDELSDAESREFQDNHGSVGDTQSTYSSAGKRNPTTDSPMNEQHVPTRKLFRDIDKKIVSGVCAGIAAYTDTPRFVIRLLVIILLFTPVSVFVFCIYLAMTLFVDPAITVNDKLRMQGRMVSPGAIWSKITEESQAFNQNVSNDNNLGNSSSGFGNAIGEAFAELSQSFKKINWGSWMWAILAVVTAVSVLMGAVFYIYPPFVDSLFSALDKLIPWFQFEVNISDSFAWLVFPILLLGFIIGMFLFLAALIIPIGAILKTQYKPLTKFLLILAWCLFIGATTSLF